MYVGTGVVRLAFDYTIQERTGRDSVGLYSWNGTKHLRNSNILGRLRNYSIKQWDTMQTEWLSISFVARSMFVAYFNR